MNKEEKVEKLMDAALKGSDFIMEQAPEVAQQVIVFGRISHTIYTILSIVIIVLGVKIYKKADWKKYGDDCDPAPLILLTIGGVMTIFMLLINLGPMIMAWFAPKLYIIQELKGLL